MSALIMFAKSPTVNSYINVVGYATSKYDQIDRILFAWYEASESVRDEVRRGIVDTLNALAPSHLCYQRVHVLFNGGHYDDVAVDRLRLNDFVESLSLSRDFFDLTALPKNDLISVISVLLGKDAKKIRFFHIYTKPMLLHEYPESSVNHADFAWLDAHDIIDEFLGFLERRDGRWVALALSGALLAAAATSAALRMLSAVNSAELAVAFVSLVGGWFSIIWSSRYFYQIARRWSRRWVKH